jgi:hypothetical protein
LPAETLPCVARAFDQFDSIARDHHGTYAFSLCGHQV